jgi:hypothetical protein
MDTRWKIGKLPGTAPLAAAALFLVVLASGCAGDGNGVRRVERPRAAARRRKLEIKRLPPPKACQSRVENKPLGVMMIIGDPDLRGKYGTPGGDGKPADRGTEDGKGKNNPRGGKREPTL